MFYRFVKAVIGPVLSLLFKVNVHGLENIEDKKIILCGNHRSNWDPVFLLAFMPFDIHFMAKKELFEFKPLGWILGKLNAFPVDREGESIGSLRTAVKLTRDDKVVGIFIEGTRVDSYDPANAKPGAIFTARMARADILPVYIDSEYKLFKNVDIYIRPIEEINLDRIEGTKEEKYKREAEFILEKIYDR